MVLEEYIALNPAGKTVDFGTKLSMIDPLELTITGVNDVFTVYLPHGGKKSVVLNPTQTLRSVLEKICNHRNMRLEEVNVFGPNGKPCDLDITLAFMTERSVTITPINDEESKPKDEPHLKKTRSFLPHLHLAPKKREHEEESSDYISPRQLTEPSIKIFSSQKRSRNSKSKPGKKAAPGSTYESESDQEQEDKDHLQIQNQPKRASSLRTSQERPASPRVTVKIPQELLDSLVEPEFQGYPFPVFEVPLEKLSTPTHPVHYLVRCSIKFLLNEEAILTEGLFRIPGSAEDTLNYRKLFDEGKEVTFSKCSYYDVAGLLKEFFRKLPEPLIPFLYDHNIKSCVEEHRSKEIDEQQLLASMKMVLEQLPKENLCTLQLLIQFLSIIISHSEVNKMNVDNMIKCIVPSIRCIPAIFYYTLNHYDFFFDNKVASTLESVSHDGTHSEKKGRGRREQPAGRITRYAPRVNVVTETQHEEAAPSAKGDEVQPSFVITESKTEEAPPAAPPVAPPVKKSDEVQSSEVITESKEAEVPPAE
jgi:hypothetical protein